jgi:hypothetical protein
VFWAIEYAVVASFGERAAVGMDNCRLDRLAQAGVGVVHVAARGADAGVALRHAQRLAELVAHDGRVQAVDLALAQDPLLARLVVDHEVEHRVVAARVGHFLGEPVLVLDVGGQVALPAIRTRSLIRCKFCLHLHHNPLKCLHSVSLTFA